MLYQFTVTCPSYFCTHMTNQTTSSTCSCSFNKSQASQWKVISCVTIQIKHPCYFYMVKPTFLLNNIIFVTLSEMHKEWQNIPK